MTTPFLRDEGELAWPLKLHLGCGNIYLKGHKNIDIVGISADTLSHAELSSYLVDIDDYYNQRMFCTDNKMQSVVDLICDFSKLPYQPSSVDKIVCIQALEHIHPTQLQGTLVHWWNLLKAGRPLILSVPDSKATLKLIKEDPDSAIRFLCGSLNGEYSSHLTWFSKKSFFDILERVGFAVTELPNFHDYPAIVVRAIKDDPYCKGREYQRLTNYQDNPKWNVLDIGPGKFPFKGATHWLDWTEHNLDISGKVFDLNSGPMPYPDKFFSYVYCSHVAEHLDDPLAFIKDIQRIGCRGYLECPTGYLDYFFQHGATHPKWQIHRAGNAFVFSERRASDLSTFTDLELGSMSWHLTHDQNRHRKLQEIVAYRNFWHNQNVLNVGYCWNKKNPIQVVVVDTNGVARW